MASPATFIRGENKVKRRGGMPYNTSTSLSPLLLLLPSVLFICSHSIQLPTSVVYNSTVDGKQFTTFYFTDFDQQQLQQPGILMFSSNASINQKALQITPDSSNSSSFLINQTGRVFCPSPFTLWQFDASKSSRSPDGKYVASFNTSFMFNLFRANVSFKGEGLTFLIASGNDEPPPGSYGGYLGLTNASTDGHVTNGFVAVELDTVKQQPYDPDDNHVGLNVNGVRSTYATPLAPHGIQLAPANASTGTYNAWVEYNGTTRRVLVYMSADESKPSAPVLNASVDLSTILLGHKAFFGFSASTGIHYQLNCVLQWMMTVETLDAATTKKASSGLKLPVIVGGSFAGLLYVITKKKKKRKKDRADTIGLTAAIPGMPKVFDYKELKKGTNDFDEKMKLGQGGYGVVYRATVPGEKGQNLEVAVKQFSGANTKGQEDFLAELSIINRLRHRNLVSSSSQLGAALQRVSGVASALNYLHTSTTRWSSTGDIKPSNIMLDSAFDARSATLASPALLDSDNVLLHDMSCRCPGERSADIAPECFPHRQGDTGSAVHPRNRLPAPDPGCRPAAGVVWRLHGAGDRILDAFDEETPRGSCCWAWRAATRTSGPAEDHGHHAELTRSVPPFAVPTRQAGVTGRREDADVTGDVVCYSCHHDESVEVNMELAGEHGSARESTRRMCPEARPDHHGYGLRRPGGTRRWLTWTGWDQGEAQW
ncbi:hypothetical protein HU200_065385 [Digitaria exilis]|uniref:Protein kinase domain-containing protein n=1 Tax=Digitaria exilis TaxID=1010633 RepID=A0A835A451_9POAL|nr:hypothetical protein HU200_065385 [Digitaria exilis]